MKKLKRSLITLSANIQEVFTKYFLNDSEPKLILVLLCNLFLLLRLHVSDYQGDNQTKHYKRTECQSGIFCDKETFGGIFKFYFFSPFRYNNTHKVVVGVVYFHFFTIGIGMPSFFMVCGTEEKEIITLSCNIKFEDFIGVFCDL